ncbi:MAG: hypothetical protein ACLQVN_24270 [Bryobacteraceae bacterium]
MNLYGAIRKLLEYGWSIAEIVEHVAIVDGRVLGAITERLAQTPLAVNPDSEKVDAITGILTHRLAKRILL